MLKTLLSLIRTALRAAISLITRDPRTSAAAIVGCLVNLAAHYGLHVSPQTQADLTVATITVIGILARDGNRYGAARQGTPDAKQ